MFAYLREFGRRCEWARETRALDLSGMGLASATLPKEVTDMTSLTELSLSQNQLTGVAPDVLNMTNLTEIDISENQTMHELAPELGVMPKLQLLITDETPITSPPQEVNLFFFILCLY